MKNKTLKLIVILLTIPSLMLLKGCAELQLQQKAPQQPQQQKEINAKRFQEDKPEPSSPVKTAVEMSQKYAKLADEHNQLKQEHKKLLEENKNLKKELQSTTEKLNQTEKELNQANDLLIEMRIELNNWKNDILGFREEMRTAEKAQLNALLKIMKLLGADANDIQNNTERIKKEPQDPNKTSS